jgi:hypothetical protein
LENLAYCDNQLEEQVTYFAQYIKCCKDNSENLLFLIDRIGATIAGVKPAELLNLPREYNCSSISWENCKDCILRNSNIKLKVIDKYKGRRHVLFYHEESLNHVLEQEETIDLLIELGYPVNYTLEEYLDYLIARLNSDEFPHEIGIFLGYPLKDVKGYLGKSNLRLIYSNGWQVYGSAHVSQRRFESFKEARYKVKRYLNTLLENRLQTN